MFLSGAAGESVEVGLRWTTLIHERMAGDVWPSGGGMVVGRLVRGCKGSFGSCGRWRSGSTPAFPRRLLSSTARPDLRPRQSWRALGRRALGNALIQLPAVVFCGSFQSFKAMGSLWPWVGWWPVALFPSQRQRFSATATSLAFRGLFVIFVSSKVLEARWLGQMYLQYPSSMYLY